MASTLKVFYEGQLPNSKTTLFTATARTMVRFASFFNTNTTAETVKVYVKRGTSRQVLQVVLNQNEFARDFEAGTLILESGDLMEGSTTTAAKVDTWIAGIEIT